jgi:hypothetical protein
MDAPLAPPGAFSTLHESDDQQQPAAGPQPLPKELRDDARRIMGLVQPQLLGVWGPGAVIALWCWSMSVCGHRALKDVKAEPAANVSAAIAAALGSICVVFCSRHMALVAHALSQLDGARVSAKGTATLSKLVKGTKGYMVFTALFQVILSVVFLIGSPPKDPYDWVAAALSVVLAAPAAVLSGPFQLSNALAYLLTTDAAEQVAADVQHVTAATADYNGLAKRVYHTHRDTVALSEVMTPLIFGQASMVLLLVLMFLFISIEPRPPPADSTWFGMGNWYNFFLNQFVAAFIATLMAAQLVWILHGPAKITSACQKIASAVNGLRVNATEADGTVTLATSEQLHRIEGLNRYINELNKNQGLGFLVLRKRITFTLVMGLMIQTVRKRPLFSHERRGFPREKRSFTKTGSGLTQNS